MLLSWWKLFDGNNYHEGASMSTTLLYHMYNIRGYPARSDTHFRRLFGVIREYLDALDSGRFNFRPGWGCAMCEHRDTHCRRWCGG